MFIHWVSYPNIVIPLITVRTVVNLYIIYEFTLVFLNKKMSKFGLGILGYTEKGNLFWIISRRR